MTDHVANEGSNLEKKVGDDKDWSGFLLKQLLSGGNFGKENTRKNGAHLIFVLLQTQFVG